MSSDITKGFSHVLASPLHSDPVSQEKLLDDLSKYFSALSTSTGLRVPPDFCNHAFCAMTNLQQGGRSNVLYKLARSLSTPRNDGMGSKFPINRMPMGLLEYMVGFFDSNTMPQVHVCVHS